MLKGGAADKTKVLKVGDEILSVNNTDCTRMSRIEAWNFMKKLVDGTASIVVRQKIVAATAAASEENSSASANSAQVPPAAAAAKSKCAEQAKMEESGKTSPEEETKHI